MSVLKRHGPAVAAALTLAGLLSAVVISAATPVRAAHSLPTIVKAERIVIDAKAGQEVWFTWAGPFTLRGNERAVVTAAELVKLQPGLRVVKLRSANTKFGAPKPFPSFVGPELPATMFPKSSMRPVTTVVFEPGQTNDETYFVAGVTATKPGTYRLEGWRLHYQSGGLDGVSTYQRRIEIRVT